MGNISECVAYGGSCVFEIGLGKDGEVVVYLALCRRAGN